jgi:hypothetical protein
LEKLLPILEALPATDVKEPGSPVPILLQEANDLRTYIEETHVRERLVAVGLPKAEITALPRAIDGLRDAQSAWVVVRDRSKSGAQQQREERASEMRSDIVASLRWNLRGNRVAQAVLDAIMEGDGVEDLTQDLADLAALTDKHADAFESDETFDPQERAEAARSMASELEAGVSEARMDRTQVSARDLRDRAATYLAARMVEIRDAGRYAFRKEPAIAAKFGSEYGRKKARKSRAKIPAEAGPGEATRAPGAAGA